MTGDFAALFAGPVGMISAVRITYSPLLIGVTYGLVQTFRNHRLSDFSPRRLPLASSPPCATALRQGALTLRC